MNRTVILLVGLTTALFAQVDTTRVDTAWVRSWPRSGNDNDYLVDMVLDSSGTVYATGHHYDNSQIVTLSYNSAGTRRWVQTFDSMPTGEDIANAIAIDRRTGSVYVTGKTYSPVHTSKDLLLVKYSNDGVRQWAVLHDNITGDDEGYDVEVDQSGYIYIAGGLGCNRPDLEWRMDGGVVKYDSMGNLVWARHHEAPFAGFFYGLVLDANSNIYVCGIATQRGYQEVQRQR